MYDKYRAIMLEKVAELYEYPGDQHLFLDSSLPSYDAEATALVVERSLELLDRVRTV